jgi:hypothetical protein
VAEDNARTSRLGRLPQKGRVLACAIPPPQEPPRPQKAILAVAASMLTAAYHMLKHDVDYRDLGADHFDRRDKAKIAHRLIQRLHALGFAVEARAA